MSAPDPIPADTTPDPTEAFARPVLERQLLRLERLAEIGLEIAEAVGRQATGALAEGEAAVGGDNPVAAFARVSRAVRLTCALQTRAVEALGELGEVRDRTQFQAVDRRVEWSAERKTRVEAVIERQIKREHESEPQDRVDHEVGRVMEDVSDWLDGGVYGDLLARPLTDIVAEICRDFGLAWDEARMAREGWALDPSSAGGAPPSVLAWRSTFLVPDPPEPDKPDPKPPDAKAKAALARAETEQVKALTRHLEWCERHMDEPEPDT